MSAEKPNPNSKKTFITIGVGLLAAIGIGVWYRHTKTQKKRAHGLLLCGAPGSGKGTQCEMLTAKYGYVHLSTGDILRDAISQGTELGKKVKPVMDRGDLVPDDLVIGIVKEKMNSSEVKSKGWILDGFPRTKNQAMALSDAGGDPDKIIVLDVPDKVLEDRVTGRRTDPVTGKIYHLTFNPPPANDEIKQRLIHRSDDTAEKLRNRLVNYHNNIDFILEFYKTKRDVNRLDGTKNKNDIFKDIEKIINS